MVCCFYYMLVCISSIGNYNFVDWSSVCYFLQKEISYKGGFEWKMVKRKQVQVLLWE